MSALFSCIKLDSLEVKRDEVCTWNVIGFNIFQNAKRKLLSALHYVSPSFYRPVSGANFEQNCYLTAVKRQGEWFCSQLPCFKADSMQWNFDPSSVLLPSHRSTGSHFQLIPNTATYKKLQRLDFNITWNELWKWI